MKGTFSPGRRRSATYFSANNVPDHLKYLSRSVITVGGARQSTESLAFMEIENLEKFVAVEK